MELEEMLRAHSTSLAVRDPAQEHREEYARLRQAERRMHRARRTGIASALNVLAARHPGGQAAP